MKLTLSSQSTSQFHVKVVGDVSYKSHDFAEPLRQLVGSFASRQILLDLEAATAIDSSGIRWLMVCRHAVTQARGELVLRSVPPCIATPLVLLNLLSKFETTDSLPQTHRPLSNEVA